MYIYIYIDLWLKNCLPSCKVGYAFLSSQCSTSFMFSTLIILNLSMNAFVHPYSAFYVILICLKPLFCQLLICILEALRTQLHILEIPIDLFILLPTNLLFYLHPIIELIVCYVLYFFKLYFMYTYYIGIFCPK